MFTQIMKLGGVAGFLLLTASLTAMADATSSNAKNTTSTGRELSGPGTHPEEYPATAESIRVSPETPQSAPAASRSTPVVPQKAPPTSTKPKNTTSTGRELTGPGTHPEEYPATAESIRVSPAAPQGTPAKVTPQKAPPRSTAPRSTKPNNTTSTGRELTGPGAQPEEYNAAGGSSKVGPYDTVHNVRIRKDTPHPDSGTHLRKAR